MKQLQLQAFGVPDQVVACLEADEPPAPGDGEVLVEMLACSINPADLLIIEGRYASRPPLPAPLGIEGAGRVLALGAGVQDLVVGDTVLSLARANWLQRQCVPSAQLIPMPATVDVAQVGMLKVNPATALLMLRDFVPVAAGDWVIQNAANSAVGRNLIRLAHAMGVRTVNVVRRPELAAELEAIGADRVLVEGQDLATQVREATGGAAIALGIDAVAGSATDRLAACLADGGTVVNYGLLSGEDCRLSPQRTVFHDIRLRGFWLASAMRSMTPAQLLDLYGDLAVRLADGTLGVPVEASYPLSACAEALRHAAREGRGGKVIFTPAG